MMLGLTCCRCGQWLAATNLNPMNIFKHSLLLLLTVLTLTLSLHAQTTNDPAREELIKLLKGLKYQQGEIDLRGGLAKLTVPKEFNFLNSDDAETVLVKLWGNPPSAEKPLGLLIPAGLTPLSSNCWVVTIDFSDDGYVKDDDAGKIKYDELLKQMQKAIADNNESRKSQGYPAITLVGWAAPPHYDAATHKLYWAKHIKFEGEEHDTLNYNIRMLGRRGVLELNAIASLEQLDAIQQQTPQILGMVNFTDGNRYADFDPKVDKVAKYGIAALVAGGLVLAAKAGFFKVLLVGLLAAKKFIILGVLALVGFFKKFFKGKHNPPGA